MNRLAKFGLINLGAFVLSVLIVSYLKPDNSFIESSGRALVNIFYDEHNSKNEPQKEITLVDFVSEDLNRFTDSLLQYNPAFVVIDLPVTRNESLKFAGDDKVIFFTEDENTGDDLKVFRNFVYGYTEEDKLMELITQKLGIYKKWFNSEFFFIRSFRSEKDFVISNSGNALFNKIVLVGYLDYNDEDFVPTPVGVLPENILLANAILTFENYGLEKTSKLSDLRFFIMLFLLNAYVLRGYLLKVNKFLLIVIFGIETVVFVFGLLALYAHFNIWINPWFAIVAGIVNLVAFFFMQGSIIKR